ncbi:transcriptional regulator NrdR [Solemya velum gill symbiont]|uniref:Transcriptional repressor NrdR n=1 Tax=Solemya velum gill symbiont TaxID=2340 RepID=A0A0B0H9L5_SOVGS|nr:transcriptional regulator NrdR [Solemya velum gill symbiont]KHF25332.1 transcriptional regulator NrdR [Solemya velum gill symbiont]OOY35131.1 transcriptional regulator NrdR [Solemya velum gill symbiont]OOY37852.1 transcriptional regulator NrdR [Solemya velum gill symbiont]OOY44388.1 transcriptional regulator NrdR [Solemya velum gill symbiont]OOY44996.1 transcriptional regulator NrdR [Solemya velum gill symbiont]
MRCPFCGAEDTKVIDSRLSGEGEQVRRRRKCTVCSERFTTYESVELNLPRVVKTDDTRVQFDGRKLRAGMSRALEKRPVSTEQVEAAINRITRKLASSGEAEVSSRSIGELVMHELRKLDQVAYVRFASVYRSFEDVRAFTEEIELLEREPTPEERRQQMKLLDEDEK